MEQISYLVGHFKKEFSVVLQDDWLKNVIAFLRSFGIEDRNDLLVASVFEQWLHEDIKITSQPTTLLTVNKAERKVNIEHGLFALQINSIIDIGSSLYGQYRKLTSKFEDISGFEACFTDGKVESEAAENSKPRRMLCMEVSDGFADFKAIEYRQLPKFSLLLSPGCKILLKAPICCRRGTLLLTQANCCVLGGDDERWMKTHRPVEMLQRHLKEFTLSNKNDGADCTIKKERAKRLSRSRSSLTKKKIEECSVNSGTGFSSGIVSTQRRSSIAATTADSSVTAPMMEIGIAYNGSEKEPLEDINPMTEFKRPSPPIRQNVRKRPPVVDLTSRSVEFRANEESFDRCLRFPQIVGKESKRPPKRSCLPELEKTLDKKIKWEIDEDDDVMIVGSTINEGSPANGTRCKNREEPLQEIRNEIDDPKIESTPAVLRAFLSLGVSSISEALRSTRFVISSKRKLIMGIMDAKPVEPLRIADGDQWSLIISLSDASHENLHCIVSHDLLSKLIGMSPAEAMAVRASNELRRKKEGQARIAALGISMKRNDLIWDVEFFPAGGATPVIHNMQTVAEMLNIC